MHMDLIVRVEAGLRAGGLQEAILNCQREMCRDQGPEVPFRPIPDASFGLGLTTGSTPFLFLWVFFNVVSHNSHSHGGTHCFDQELEEP